MEYGDSIHLKYLMIVLQMLFGITLMVTNTVRAYRLYRAVVMYVTPYFLSFSPVVLLVYLLYMVSYRF